ncbi:MULTISPECIES: LysR family transcriptional regulator [Citrobacter]|mgnify:FL=1|uniref:LysR family transcriptional regulator n=1 Tax=Citrobacter TaxID=544 RepID=UPI0002675613|nr:MULTISPECIES: LysR family transcriptional regulator [unclassified Citrobacter]EIQ80084.1 bacterial regulatory helix-turn-helix, lysR family protein [Shigella flexneri 1235-66]HEE0140617.1 LysR family transcriptional regulator [Citrobacter youngae]MBJ9884545.1 LysR family transcriptional regulator [Citrobacter sp. FDAARGOS_156]MDM2717515.1 LysR family transcriptional regulator [Citrobacter sp. Cy232]TKU39147.1 LysR family transcriptional regulator [Citrobacter sp. wls716]
MDIADFRTIIALVETGTITAAANLLCRVPSAITTRVQNLESQLGTTLFVRSGRRFLPTNEGQVLYNNALKIIELVTLAEQQMVKPVPGGRFRLGALDSMAATRLPEPLARLYQQHQSVKVELVTGISRTLLDAVLSHELDAAFIADAPANDRLERMVVYKEELVIIAAANFPLIRSAADLAHTTLLVFSDGCSYRDRLTTWFREAGIRPYRLAEMSSYHAILGGVSAGMGAGVIPTPILDTFPTQELITIHPFDSENSQITTELIWRKGDLTANTGALIDILASTSKLPDRQSAAI